MDDEIKEEIEHKRTLIKDYTRRLRVLERQVAKFGLHTPSYIQVEIEEINENIQILISEIEIRQQKLKTTDQQIQKYNQQESNSNDSLSIYPEVAYCNRCSACDTLLGPGLIFCTNCGTRVVQPFSQSSPVVYSPTTPSLHPQHNQCSLCDAPLSPGLIFCTNCGNRVTTHNV